MLTALHKVKGCEVCFLSSGHSHEDVDAFFSGVRAHVQRNHELWTPQAFQLCIQEYLNDPQTRPYEPVKTVEMLPRYHDWIL